ncbi:outer membrane beta-barrel protein [Desulfomarina profundi]|uniref:outer membrane beta-barrel protein n=1 Tax=Desulfomarina profundi TaxID=2772557 RepID=UPI001E42790A|nr:outer membrane beta-barrel protein [Desulfomarina profundi]
MEKLRMSILWKALLAGSVLLILYGSAVAKIIIQPKIHSGVMNNSNFWKAENDEVSVNTYYTKPGIVFGYEAPKTEISVDATVDFQWFDDQDTPPAGVRDSSDDNFVGFTGELKANHQLTDRLNIGIADQLYVTRDPARSDGNSNSIARDKYTINYLEPSIYYEFADKFGLMTKYRHTITDYEKGLEDSNEHRGIFDLFYILNRSAAVYVDYQVWQREYDQNSNDYVSNLVSLNYEHELNYFTLKAGAGYHHRSFDEGGLSDLDLFSWKIQIKGMDPDSTPKTTRSRIGLFVGQEMNDDGTGDNYFTASYVRFEGGYRFFERLETSVKAAFQNSDYDTDARDEDTYLAALRLAYSPVDYLTFGVEAGLETRDSNVAGNDYDDTFVMFTLDFDYDLGSR